MFAHDRPRRENLCSLVQPLIVDVERARGRGGMGATGAGARPPVGQAAHAHEEGGPASGSSEMPASMPLWRAAGVEALPVRGG